MITNSTVRDTILAEMAKWHAPKNRRQAKQMFNRLADRLILMFQFAAGMKEVPTSDMLGQIIAEEVVHGFNDRDSEFERSLKLDVMVQRVVDYMTYFTPKPNLPGLPGGPKLGT